MAGEAVAPFVFEDQGSLVSLSEYSSVGSLMGSLTQGQPFRRGPAGQADVLGAAQAAPAGPGRLKKTALITLSELLDRTYRPRIKLH